MTFFASTTHETGAIKKYWGIKFKSRAVLLKGFFPLLFWSNSTILQRGLRGAGWWEDGKAESAVATSPRRIWVWGEPWLTNLWASTHRASCWEWRSVTEQKGVAVQLRLFLDPNPLAKKERKCENWVSFWHCHDWKYSPDWSPWLVLTLGPARHIPDGALFLPWVCYLRVFFPKVWWELMQRAQSGHGP